MAEPRPRARTRTRTFYTGDYEDRLNALEREARRLEQAADNSSRRLSDSSEYREKVAEFEALKAEAEADGLTVVLQEPRRSEWRALKEKHPPRTAPEDVAEADARWGVNLEAVEDDLVYTCLVSPQFKSRQAFDEWVDDELGPSGLGACAQVAFFELLMAAPDPKSRPALPTLTGDASDE